MTHFNKGLDPRIKSPSDIFEPTLDVERVTPFIGQKGYFTKRVEDLADLSCCIYGELLSCGGAFFRPHLNYYWGRSSSGTSDYFIFYIPESSLAPAEKRFRPYTPEEFCNEFNIGERVIFRKKDDPESQQDLIMQGVWFSPRDGKTVIYARLGSYLYALEELFNDYEWRRPYKMDFVPFGVEE